MSDSEAFGSVNKLLHYSLSAVIYDKSRVASLSVCIQLFSCENDSAVEYVGFLWDLVWTYEGQ